MCHSWVSISYSEYVESACSRIVHPTGTGTSQPRTDEVLRTVAEARARISEVSPSEGKKLVADALPQLHYDQVHSIEGGLRQYRRANQ